MAPATPSRCWRLTGGRSATRARSSPRWSSATPSGRSTPPTRTNAAARSSLDRFFSEELGPHVRLLAFHELGKDPERFEAVIARTTPGPVARLGSGAVTYARTYTGLRFGVRSEEAAELARTKIVAALDRLEAELGSGEYLVGDSFSVADLSAASLFFPLVLPEEGPVPTDEPPPAGMESFRAPLRDRPGYRWVEETFRRHRWPTQVSLAA